MSALETYIRRAIETRGLEHAQAMRTLRWYMRSIPERELIRAISSITKTEYLRTLWEAGLTNRLQQAVTRRYDELKKQKEE